MIFIRLHIRIKEFFSIILVYGWVASEYTLDISGVRGFQSIPLLHLHALEVKEVEESQGVQHVQGRAVGIVNEEEDEFNRLVVTIIERRPIVGPKEN
jgi:hypothetical protein